MVVKFFHFSPAPVAGLVLLSLISMGLPQPPREPALSSQFQSEDSVLMADSSVLVLDSNARIIDFTEATPEESKSYQKLSAKEPWEHIVSAPGYVLNAPFWVLNKGIEQTIYFVDENKIVPKVKRVLISEDETRVIMPAYDIRVGSGIKVTKAKLFSDSSMLVIGANHGFDSRRGAKIYFWETPGAGNSTFDFEAEYQNLYDVEFFGWGPDSKLDDEGEYLNSQLEADLLLKIPLAPGFRLETGPGYRYHNIRNGEGDDEPILTRFPQLLVLNRGFEPDLNLGKAKINLDYNSLSPPGHPLTGIHGQLGVDYFHELGQEKYHFAIVEADYQQYFHLFYDRTLHIRLNSSLVRSFKGRSLPFYYLSELGETGTIRGFERGRFRDRDRIFGNLEYRYPIWSPEYRVLEVVAFLDAGQVTSDLFRRFDWEKMRYGYGFGLRAYSRKNRVLSWEFGFSEESFRMYFLLN